MVRCGCPPPRRGSDIRALIDLADQSDQDCSAVDEITIGHLEVVETKIAQFETQRSELVRMLDQCRGRQVADCRIIESLSDHAGCPSAHALPTTGPIGGQAKTV